jgi:hypothetical protein
MNLKHATRKNTVHWIDGIGINIAPDGIARGVPAHIAAKLLTNVEVWSAVDGDVGPAPGSIANAAPSVVAPSVPVLVPESLTALEGMTLDQIHTLGRLFYDDAFAAEDVKAGARSILAAADVQLAQQLRDMLRSEAERVAHEAAPAETAPEAPQSAPEPAPVPEAPVEEPSALDAPLDAPGDDLSALEGVPVIETGKTGGKGARKPQGRR